MAQAQPAVKLDQPRQPLLSKRNVAGLIIFGAVLAFFLTQTRLPAVLRKLPALDRGATGRNRTAFTQVIDPDTYPEALRWVAYGINLWDANAIGMLFALLLGGAAMAALSPGARIRELLSRRRGAAGAGLGGALGLPLFMCSACSAPVSLGFLRAGASVETTLGIILGSALFNPVGLFAITYLMSPEMTAARVGFGLLAVFALIPLASKAALSCPLPEPAAEGGSPAGDTAADTWGRAVLSALKVWWKKTSEMAVRLTVPMLVAGFVVGAVLTFAPPQELSDAVGSTVAATVVAAALGTLLQLPTLFEIPLVIGALALGLGAGPATALLVTAPSTGLITFGVTRKDLGWKTPALMLLGTFIGGIIAGLVVGSL